MKVQIAMQLLTEEKNRKGRRVVLVAKKFEPRNDLEELKDYGQDPGEEFWNKVGKWEWSEVKDRKCGIKYWELEKMAKEHNYPLLGTLRAVMTDLEVGARLGVKEENRVPSTSTNAPSAIEAGYQVTDAVVGWLKDGYAIGPFEVEDLPFENVKISGLMCKIKPNGKARVINNMSGGKPNSVNDGIDKRDYVYSMSSTKAWIRIMVRCGRYCKFVKVDWAEAYKQIPVCKEDVELQGFAWLGKVFFELALVFGCVASVGIYDRAAKVVLYLAQARAEVPAYLGIQHLDDVCYCSPEKSLESKRMYEAYLEVCNRLNVKLAPEGQKDKMFGPSTDGEVLGVNYDSVEMVWYLSEKKLSAILALIDKLREEGEGSVREFKKLCGKLVDIRDLIEGAKFHLAHLIMAASMYNQKEDMDEIVEVDEWLEKDLYYFSLVLPVYGRRTELQDPDRRPMAGAEQAYTDAAGGSRTSVGRGVGMLVSGGKWSFIPWGRRINEGWRAYDGKSLAHKMSAWELVGPLVASRWWYMWTTMEVS